MNDKNFVLSAQPEYMMNTKHVKFYRQSKLSLEQGKISDSDEEGEDSDLDMKKDELRESLRKSQSSIVWSDR